MLVRIAALARSATLVRIAALGSFVSFERSNFGHGVELLEVF